MLPMYLAGTSSPPPTAAPSLSVCPTVPSHGQNPSSREIKKLSCGEPCALMGHRGEKVAHVGEMTMSDVLELGYPIAGVEAVVVLEVVGKEGSASRVVGGEGT